MTGILSAMLGISSGLRLTAGSASFTVKGITTYYYGYSNSASTSIATPPTWGSIAPGLFQGVSIKALYSQSNSIGNAASYVVIFAGNRSAGFFNTLRIDGTLVSGTLSSPSYNSTNNETSFTIALASTVASLLTADCTVVLT